MALSTTCLLSWDSGVGSHYQVSRQELLLAPALHSASGVSWACLSLSDWLLAVCSLLLEMKRATERHYSPDGVAPVF